VILARQAGSTLHKEGDCIEEMLQTGTALGGRVEQTIGACRTGETDCQGGTCGASIGTGLAGGSSVIEVAIGTDALIGSSVEGAE
jgi:hypothetical protein